MLRPFALATSRPARVVTVMPFGDSITEGFNSTDFGGWRSRLSALAQADGKRVRFVGSRLAGPATVGGQPFSRDHEGHPGAKIADVYQYAGPPNVGPPPDVVLLMIGINDVNDPPNMPTIQTRLQTLLSLFAANMPSSLVVLAQNTPYQGIGAQPDFDAMVAAIPSIVATRAAAGQRIMSVNQSGMPLSELSDTVHPNDAGHARMATIWYPAIRNVL